jgi:hypothetical protein
MRQHIGRWFPERQFPFADAVTNDPVTGQTDGVLGRCLATGTCPDVFEVNSEEEYWNKVASLLTTDTQGNDLDLASTPNVRYYLLSDLSHAVASGLGICQQQQNPLSPAPVLRALLEQLGSGQTEAACNIIAAFANHTRAQAGRQLTDLQASDMLTAAARIQSVIGC